MSFWYLVQIVVDLVFLSGMTAILFRLYRPAKDDPRLSRGLQLLQTKISILEDLSDRTDTQVSQLTALLENKVQEMQRQLIQADKQIQKIEMSMSKSLEVARIFQDRIPHQEIIERQNTIKYVKAARLAHQGMSVDEITKQVDLSRGEIEFIAKVNRDQLQFSIEELPEWAINNTSNTQESESQDRSVSSISFSTPLVDFQSEQFAKTADQVAPVTSLTDLGEKFRRVISPEKHQAVAPQAPLAVKPKESKLEPKLEFGKNSRGDSIEVKKIVFPKVNLNNNLS